MTDPRPKDRWLGFSRGHLVALVVLALALGLLPLLPQTTVPDPPAGAFTFAALGDAPYSFFEEWQYRPLLRQLAAADLEAVIHVGDILGRSCADRVLLDRLDNLEQLPHPVLYTPGDNEWWDCHTRGAGSFAPLERLARLRDLFFGDPASSLGGEAVPVVSQGLAHPDDPTQRELVENVRWVHRGVVFTTVHLIGGLHWRSRFAGRSSADDEEALRRTEGGARWLREAFVTARAEGARAVVVAGHADPLFELAQGDPERSPLEPFLVALEEEVSAFEGPVLFVHGDSHDYTVDRPLVDRRSGRQLDNLTRLQVPGSPEIAWVRVVVDPDRPEPFSFERYLVPRWRLY